MEATYNGTVAQLYVEYLPDDLDMLLVRTSTETQFVNADVTLRNLPVLTLGGVAPSLSHMQVVLFLTFLRMHRVN